MSEDWYNSLPDVEPVEEKSATPDWYDNLPEVGEEGGPDAEVTVEPWVSPVDKQQNVKETIADLRAKHKDVARSQEAYRISREEGLPEDIAYRQADKFIKSRKETEWKALRKDAPYSARHLSEGDNLSRYSEDDVKKLGEFERMGLQLQKTHRENLESVEIGDIGYRMKTGTATKQDETRLNEIRALQSSRPEFDDGWIPWIASMAEQGIVTTGTAMGRALPAAAQGAAAGAATALVAGQAGPQVLTPEELVTAPLGAITGATLAFTWQTMAETFGMVSGQAYLAAKESLDEDGNQLDEDTASAVANVTGLVGAVLEKFGLKAYGKVVAPHVARLVSKNGVKEMVKRMGTDAVLKSSVTQAGKAIALGGVAEGAQELGEQLTQIASIMYSGGVYDPQGEFTSDQLSAQNLATTFLGAFIGGTAMSGGLKLGSKSLELAAKPIVSKFQRQKAENGVEDLIKMGDNIRDVESSPEALNEYAQGLDADAPSTAAAPPEAVLRLFQDAGLDEEAINSQFPELAQAMDDAETTGADIPLPHETLIKVMRLDKAAYDEFAQDIRMGNEMSGRDAQKASKDWDKDAGLVDEEADAKRTEVHNAIRDQLIASGTAPDAAETMAQVQVAATVNVAKSVGMDPVEFAKRYNMQIQPEGKTPPGPDAMLQNTPEFQRWFGDSKVVDEQGRPQVYYHSTRTKDISIFWSMTHFGTAEAANGRAANLRPDLEVAGGEIKPLPGENIVPVYLSIKKPLDIGSEKAGEAGTWETQSDMLDQVSDAIRDKGNWDVADAIYQISEDLRDGEGIHNDTHKNELYTEAAALIENAGYDGVMYTNLIEDFGKVSYIPLRPEQIKSVNNRGTFDPVDPNILYQSVGNPNEGLTPNEEAMVNPIYKGSIPTARMKSNADGAKWLEENFPGKAITDFTATLSDSRLRSIGNVMAAEAMHALKRTGNASSWYSEAMQTAIGIASVKWPALLDDNYARRAGFGTAANTRFVFTYIMAVTSQNLDVAANAAATNKAFDEMVELVRGQNDKTAVPAMSKKWGTGDKRKAMGENFAKFKPLMDSMDGDTFPEKLANLDKVFRLKMTVKEWDAHAKAVGLPFTKPSNTAMDAVVYGSSVLGPKIGNGFWQNLNGNFNPLTIDLWMRRTWGRLTGKSIGNPEALPAQMARLKASLKRSRSRTTPDHIQFMEAYLAGQEHQFALIKKADHKTAKSFAEAQREAKAEITNLKAILADLKNLKAPEPWRAEYATDEKQLAAFAKRLEKAWKAEYDRLRETIGDVPDEVQPTWAKAAKTIITNLTQPLDQINNGTQRKQVEKAVEYAKEKLKERGIDVTTADLQAILWYPEKELWGALKDKLDVNDAGAPIIPPSSLNESYDTVFARILKGEGYETKQAAAGDAAGGAGSRTVFRQDVQSGAPEGEGVLPVGAEQRSTGRGRSTRGGHRATAPLAGAPTVRGISGPVPGLVEVAERYARQNGIDLKPQAEFVQVSEERATRIADAYEQMPHSPQDPVVREAYENLIQQTLAQYHALADAGYDFYFIDLSTDEGQAYAGSPWNAMMDIRENRTMGVFSTMEGFGSDADFDPDQNPLLMDTGLEWPMGPDGEMRKVLGNDLFRAVHDAFGHGLEGAGFRARGEENAWQAHVRLFTGTAVAAITTETRGQNSWLNYGPHGEANRTASTEDTIFADQKTGLMPEWTWTEGRAADETETLYQADPIFYSAVLVGVEQLAQPKAPGAQWLSTIKNIPGVKQEEIETLGLEDWLKGQKSVTKEELIEYINANRLDVRETLRGKGVRQLDTDDALKLIYDATLNEIKTLGEVIENLDEVPPEGLDALWDGIEEEAFKAYEATSEAEGNELLSLALKSQLRNLKRKARHIERKEVTPRWEGQYITPGGKDYRELVITLPGQIEPYKPDDMHFTTEGGGTAIGWVRFDERIGPNGERRLHIGEVQSKRHQDAAKKGYYKDPTPAAVAEQKRLKKELEKVDAEIFAKFKEYTDARRERGETITPEEVLLTREEMAVAAGMAPERATERNQIARQLVSLNERIRSGVKSYTVEQQDANHWKIVWEDGTFSGGYGTETAALFAAEKRKQGVPDAPFKTTWHELAMKRMLRYAVDNGFDEITWDSGRSQIDRYQSEVNQNVDEIVFEYMDLGDGTTGYSIDADKDGKTVYTSEGLTEDDLERLLGKEMANKIVANEGVDAEIPLRPNARTLKGDDLSIGGHFLKKRYDKDLPRYMAKLTKKMDGKVGVTEMPLGDEHGGEIISKEWITWNTKRIELTDKLNYLINLPEYHETKPSLFAAEASEYTPERIKAKRDSHAEKIDNLQDEIGHLMREEPKRQRMADVWSLPITDKMRETASKGLPLFQRPTDARGYISFGRARDIFTVTLTGKANLSTFLHESGHYWLEVMQDLIEKGEAPEQMVNDLTAIRKWAGVKEGERFTVAHHEKWAQAFEKYLMEGRAPSTALQQAFSRFKAWLSFIYRKGGLDVELTDEVRGVMDRLLADEEAIAEARTQVGIQEMPMTAKQLNMRPDEYMRYSAAWFKAREGERAELDRKALADYQAEQKQAWRDGIARHVEEITANLKETKGWQTWQDLQESPVKIYKESIPEELRGHAKGLTSDNAIHPPLDVLAEKYGYATGEEMLQDIAGAKAQAKNVRAQAHQNMVEEHGHLTPSKLADEALLAVHGDDQVEVNLVEFRALAEQAGIKVVPGLGAWMRSQAEQKVSQLTKRQLEPGRWRRAELKAAKESATAAAKGKVNDAALAKRRQMMAAAMFRASTEAQESVDKTRRYLVPFTKNKRRAALGKAGEMYIDAIDELLEGVSLTQISGAQARRLNTLADLIAKAEADEEPLHIPEALREQATRKNFADMTMEELQGLKDAVDNIWHLAKLKNKLKGHQRQITRDKFIEEVDKQARDNLGTRRPMAVSNPTAYDKVVNAIRWARSHLVKTEFLMSWMGSSATEMVFDVIAKADHAKWEMGKEIQKPITERLRNMSAEQRKRLNSTVHFMGDTWNNGPATGWQIFMAAMNMGNESNFDKLVRGFGWEGQEAQLKAEVNAFLTKEDFDLIQNLWDDINKLWPHIERETFKATGLKPPKIEPQPLETPYGTYAGGYFPAAYDTDHPNNQIPQAKLAEDGTFGNNMFRPHVDNGMTKGRTKVASPMRLNIDVLTNHVTETIHFITHYEAVKQVDSILRDQRFKNIVTETIGKEFHQQLVRWLKDIANDSYHEKGFGPGERLGYHLRTGTSMAYLGFGAATIAKQQLGLFTAAVSMKPQYWVKGIMSVYQPVTGLKNMREVYAESVEIQKLIDTFDRDFAFAAKQIAGKSVVTARDHIMSAAMKGIGWSQFMVNVATYIGARDQALSEGMDRKAAIRAGEAAVRMTQSAAGMKDLSAVQRGTEMTRLATPFFSFAAVLYNRLETLRVENKGVKDVPKTLAKLMMLIVAPVMAETLISELMRDEEREEDDTIEKELMLQTASYFLMGFPVVRDVLSYNFSPQLTPYAKAYENFQAVPKIAWEYLAEDEMPTQSVVKKAVTGISVATKLPLHQPYKWLDEYYGEKFFDD